MRPAVAFVFNLAPRARFDDVSNSVLRQLHGELRACQRRLGTPAELPGDFERVLALAHDLNNRLTVECLRLATEGEPALHSTPTLAAVCREYLQR